MAQGKARGDKKSEWRMEDFLRSPFAISRRDRRAADAAR